MSAEKMKISRIYGPGDFRVEEMEIPSIGEEDTLLKVEAAGLCGGESDSISKYRGGRRGFVLGHEYSGTIVEVGDKVQSVKVGDRVIGGYMSPCGKCWECRNGRPGICRNREVFGGSLDGAFAQYMRVPRADLCLTTIPENISCQEGALMSCHLVTSIWGVEKADVRLGDVVAVFGLGTVGIGVVLGAKLNGASYVVGLDPLLYRQKIAKEFGADAVFNPTDEEALKEVSKFNDGAGVDCAIVAASAPASVQQAWSVTRRGGRVAMMATVGTFQLHWDPHVEKELVGVSGMPGVDYMAKVANLLHSGKINQEKYRTLITHQFPLEQLFRAIEVNANKEENVMKVIIQPWS